MLTDTSPESAVRFEVWLPDAAAWNGKVLATGNGGYSSTLSYSQMAQGLHEGYAVGGSNTGHDGDGLEFGVNQPEKIRDWAYRSTHVLAQDAKRLVAAFYGKPPQHSYFEGCSTGGQQGLSEAQRYPDDFDGIVAGDPGNDRILLNADFVESWLTTHPKDAPAFPVAKLALLNKAAVAACDKQDGVADGVIEEPNKCSFDPGSLACEADGDSASCLTHGEVEIVRHLYEGSVRDRVGKSIYAGWVRGSEAGWGSYLVSPSQPVRVEFWKSWVFEGGSFDLQNFDPFGAIEKARTKLPFVEAVDADLRAFQKSGRKLLMYHGWADPVVPPLDTVDYYNKVQRALGKDGPATVRLFMVPGMGHCGGGPGATTFDALGVLDAWVSGIKIPETINATHIYGGKSSFTRPLCAFPKVARWDGRGDPLDSSSFRCVEDH